MEINFVKYITFFNIYTNQLSFLFNLNFTIHVKNLG